MSFDVSDGASLASNEIVSIPFEQGDVFRPTTNGVSSVIDLFVSIPFEQGDVFRQLLERCSSRNGESQSLSSRAMSFDKKQVLKN